LNSSSVSLPRPPKQKAAYRLVVVLLLLAFFLRVHQLGASSLRGDEAFSVRYWAQSPAETLQNLAWVEPHPFGTFFGFWAWKSIAGESEFAMRLLPALTNLLGTAAMFVLARRLGWNQGPAFLAAFLWALNPNLVWHSQDVRNYAVWAGLSVISLWLLLRAADDADKRAWLVYGVSAVLALYMFYLEAFFIVVHGAYLVFFRRRALKSWMVTMLIVGVALLPWLYQAWQLAGSGYGGTAARSDLGLLINQFVPELLYGEGLSSFGAQVPGVFITAWVVVSALLLWREQRDRALVLALLLLIIPSALLFIAGTRVDVFRPRYILASTPALILIIASVARLWFARWKSSYTAIALTVGSLLLIVSLVISYDALDTWYAGGAPKAPNWRVLSSFLNDHITAENALVVQSAEATTGRLDPAFAYYYRAPFTVLPHPEADTQSSLEALLDAHRHIWIVENAATNAAMTQALAEIAQPIGTQRTGDFVVRLYASATVSDDEVQYPLALSLGGGQLRGYSLWGTPRTDDTLYLILYWDTPPTNEWKAFVHVIGTPRADGSPLWAQADQYPNTGTPRDVYAITLADVPAGDYELRMGLYNESDGTRAEIRDANTDEVIGDSAALVPLRVLP
jgi:Dolichyl-phosphate-mannose-protein mannosyltransferase